MDAIRTAPRFSALASLASFQLCRSESSRLLSLALESSDGKALSFEAAPLLNLASACLDKAARLCAPRRSAAATLPEASRWARSKASSLMASSSASYLRALSVVALPEIQWRDALRFASESFALAIEAEAIEDASGAPLSRPAAAQASFAQAGLLEALARARLSDPKAAVQATERIELARRVAKCLPAPAASEFLCRALAWGGSALFLSGDLEAGRQIIFESASISPEGLQSIPGGIPEGVIQA